LFRLPQIPRRARELGRALAGSAGLEPGAQPARERLRTAKKRESEAPMHSTDHFLTTHTGSLPRPDDLAELMIATQKGEDVDPDVLEARIVEAVEDSVRRQVEAGIDIVNDGEMSKPSYATYVL